jgi:hypothetical protein
MMTSTQVPSDSGLKRRNADTMHIAPERWPLSLATN